MDNFQPALGLLAEKEKIAANGEYNLSGERYRENGVRSSRFPIVPLGEVANVIAGQSPPGSLITMPALARRSIRARLSLVKCSSAWSPRTAPVVEEPRVYDLLYRRISRGQCHSLDRRCIIVDMDAGGIAFAPPRLELEVASSDNEPLGMIVVQPHRLACQSRQMRILSRTSTPTFCLMAKELLADVFGYLR